MRCWLLAVASGWSTASGKQKKRVLRSFKAGDRRQVTSRAFEKNSLE